MKVFVYFNLHTGLWSVKALSGEHKGRVVCHADGVELAECEFRVSEAGRQRVIREQKKNVHAGVVGYLVSVTNPRWRYVTNWCGVVSPVHPHTRRKKLGARRVTYNPYKGRTFVAELPHLGYAEIYGARHVSMLADNRQVLAFS